ncbi:MFS transporter [Streptomyces antioxidans]|uniref:MFS transporter n=1 Tax=Streptomyces antioxidans TaxID=1507734 RepID=A0A1V4D5U5_9ACTN|nr:MFS transporter [Streptomyces antioxidans]OPF79647.1 MFS transporter [Streptomyces antioxidans]
MTSPQVAPGAAKPTGRFRWFLAGGLLLPVTFVMSMDRAVMSATAPVVQKEFSFTVTEMSVILTSFWWAYALFQVPGGLLAKRFGPRKVLALAGIWWSLFTFATPYGVVFLGFVVIRILLGMGQAPDWPASVYTLQRWFPRHEQSRANSLLLCGLYLGNVVGSPLVVWIIGEFGWQDAFHAFAVAGLLLAVVWWWVVRDEPREHPSVRADEASYIEAGRYTGDDSKKLPWRAFTGSGQFWAIGMQYACLLLIQGFFQTWLPTYLVDARGLSLEDMGFLASLPWIAMLVCVFGAGALNDRVLRRWPSRVRLAAAGYLVAAAALVTGALAHSVPLLITFLCVSLGAVGVVQVQVWAACQDLGGSYSATLTGWTNLWGNLMAAAGPLFTGILVGIGGNWLIALLILAIAGLLGAVCWLFVHPERPLQTPRAATAHGTTTMEDAV